MSGVVLTGQLMCRSSREADTVAELLPQHMELTRAEPGCVSFDVSRTDDPLVWQVDEQFAHETAFAAHQERVQASEWGRATASLERRYTITGLQPLAGTPPPAPYRTARDRARHPVKDAAPAARRRQSLGLRYGPGRRARPPCAPATGRCAAGRGLRGWRSRPVPSRARPSRSRSAATYIPTSPRSRRARGLCGAARARRGSRARLSRR